MPERPKGADCKSAASCFGGSNPSAATARRPRPVDGAFVVPGRVRGRSECHDLVDGVSEREGRRPSTASAMRRPTPPIRWLYVSAVIEMVECRAAPTRSRCRPPPRGAPFCSSCERHERKTPPEEDRFPTPAGQRYPGVQPRRRLQQWFHWAAVLIPWGALALITIIVTLTVLDRRGTSKGVMRMGIKITYDLFVSVAGSLITGATVGTCVGARRT